VAIEFNPDSIPAVEKEGISIDQRMPSPAPMSTAVRHDRAAAAAQCSCAKMCSSREFEKPSRRKETRARCAWNQARESFAGRLADFID